MRAGATTCRPLGPSRVAPYVALGQRAGAVARWRLPDPIAERRRQGAQLRLEQLRGQLGRIGTRPSGRVPGPVERRRRPRVQVRADLGASPRERADAACGHYRRTTRPRLVPHGARPYDGWPGEGDELYFVEGPVRGTVLTCLVWRAKQRRRLRVKNVLLSIPEAARRRPRLLQLPQPAQLTGS